jgi:hypothetical protein
MHTALADRSAGGIDDSHWSAVAIARAVSALTRQSTPGSATRENRAAPANRNASNHAVGAAALSKTSGP